MSPYEDHERLHTEVNHLRTLLADANQKLADQEGLLAYAKKELDRARDTVRHHRRRITFLNDAIKHHDDIRDDCYSIAEKMKEDETDETRW